MLRHLDSPTGAMDLVEDGVGQGTWFSKGSYDSKLDSRQDVGLHLQFLVCVSIQELEFQA